MANGSHLLLPTLGDYLPFPHFAIRTRRTDARGANAITIASRHLAQDTDTIIIPDVDDNLTPLLSVVPAQLLAYYTSLGKGYDVDKPRNLAKSVTVM